MPYTVPRNKTITLFGLDVQALAEALTPLLAAELIKALPEVASKLARTKGQVLSKNAASKMSRCRSSVVKLALESGALKGRRHGRRWLIQTGDVTDWINEGRPTR